MAPRKKYELTPEHRAQLEPWRDRWIGHAMSTKAMDEDERERVRVAIRGMYAAAKLAPPKVIAFVPSPFVLAFAAGFARALNDMRGQKGAATDAATWAATRDATLAATRAATLAATRDATWAATDAATRAATRAATEAATRAATDAATDAATWAATRDATWAATDAATWAATRDATWAATRAATEAATRAATDAATWAATRDATWAATRAATEAATRDATWDATWAATRDADPKARLADWYPSWLAAQMKAIATEMAGAANAKRLLEAAYQARGNAWNGGNQWAGYPAFLSFFRHVAGLDLDYSAWDHYEVAAIHSGPRVMYADFCMVSDRPEVLTVDAQNRPHNDTGPFCKWRDGTALYSIHGIRVPGWVVEHPEAITVNAIHKEQNEEVRRVMVERYGLAKYVRDAKFDVLDEDKDPLGLPRRLLKRGDVVVVELTNSTEDAGGKRRVYHVPVEPSLRPMLPDGELGEPQKMTALNAVASTFGMTGKEYSAMAVET